MLCTDTVRSMDFSIKYWALCKAGGNGPAALVLAGQVFLKVKMKIHFYENQVMNKSASVIKRYKIIGGPHIMLSRYSVVQKAK